MIRHVGWPWSLVMPPWEGKRGNGISGHLFGYTPSRLPPVVSNCLKCFDRFHGAITIVITSVFQFCDLFFPRYLFNLRILNEAVFYSKLYCLLALFLIALVLQIANLSFLIRLLFSFFHYYVRFLVVIFLRLEILALPNVWKW